MIETKSAFEQQLEKVLASAGFQSSRQLSHFLEFTAGRALRGETTMSQFEIAAEVLGKSDFDPTVDASVRKLATQVRQRLEKYYETVGVADPVVITLPLRSYSPHFELRRSAPPPVAPKRLPWVPVAILAAAGAVYWMWPSPSAEASPEIEIQTAFGDLRAPGPDAALGALRLGPPLGAIGEVTTRLTFSPTQEGQHAGLILWEGPRRYVSIGRRFASRNTVSLTSESGLAGTAVQETIDLEGQSGQPVWLKLRREGDRFTAFTSLDAHDWQPVGQPVEFKLSANSRAGIFAFNGRRNAPSIPARFLDPARHPTRKFDSTCADNQDLTSGQPLWGTPCESSWSQPAPAGPGWSFTTRIDTDDSAAISAGLFVRGASNTRLRLVRYRTDASSIAWIQDGRLLESAPDFPGRPPVHLRIRHDATIGAIVGEYSLDGLRYRRVGTPVAIDATTVGRIASRRTEVPERAPLAVRFLGTWQDLTPLEPIAFPRRP